MTKELLTTLGLLVIALIAVLGAFLSRLTINVSSNSNPGLSVSGVGKVALVPDIARFTAGTVAQNRTISAAQKTVNETTDGIKKALAGLGIEKKDIKTQSYVINPIYENRGAAPRIREYEVRHEFLITIRSLDKIDQAVEKVVEAGANAVGSVSFTVEDKEKLLAEAREEAMKEAKEKAQTSARLAGARLGPIISIDEYISSPYPEFGYLDGRGGASPGLEPGTSEIELTVNLTYSLQ